MVTKFNVGDTIYIIVAHEIHSGEIKSIDKTKSCYVVDISYKLPTDISVKINLVKFDMALTKEEASTQMIKKYDKFSAALMETLQDITNRRNALLRGMDNRKGN